MLPCKYSLMWIRCSFFLSYLVFLDSLEILES